MLKFVTVNADGSTWFTQHTDLADAIAVVRGDKSGMSRHVQTWHYYNRENGGHFVGQKLTVWSLPDWELEQRSSHLEMVNA